MSAADHRTNKAPTNSWRRFLADSSGVSTTEYGLMVAGLTLLVLGSAPAVGSAVSGGLRTVSDHLDGSARAIGLPEADGSGAGNEILRLAVPECQPGQMLAYDQAGLTCADPNFLDRRKGAVAGNRMENGLDMNGYAIRNAGIITSTPPAQPTAPGDYTTKQYVDTAIREALEEGKYGVATQAWVDRQATTRITAMRMRGIRMRERMAARSPTAPIPKAPMSSRATAGSGPRAAPMSCARMTATIRSTPAAATMWSAAWAAMTA